MLKLYVLGMWKEVDLEKWGISQFPRKTHWTLLKERNSTLLHSGLNPAWYFWLSTKFSCCPKMISVEKKIKGIFENNCSRKYTEMFKTDSFLGNKKLSLKPECLAWSRHYATGCLVAFLGEIRLKYEKIILWSSSRAFSLSTVVNSEATWKRTTKCNKFLELLEWNWLSSKYNLFRIM